MRKQFTFDVFLSYSSKDKTVVRALAQRLRTDHLSVWFDEWVLRPGDNIPVKIEEGLERSRVLVLCMSENASSSDWMQLESGTFRFRDPLNKDRRFIPLRLDESPTKGSLGQFLHLDWLPENRDQHYTKLLEACRPFARSTAQKAEPIRNQVVERTTRLDSSALVITGVFNFDGQRVLTSDDDDVVRLWDVRTGVCLQELRGHKVAVYSIILTSDQRHALSASGDHTIRLWDLEKGNCSRIFRGHTRGVNSVACRPDERFALSASADGTIRLWDMASAHCVGILEGHTDSPCRVLWSARQHRALSAGLDMTVRLWDLDSGHCIRIFEGHTASVGCLAWSSDERRALSGGEDRGLRLWDVPAGRCIRVLEGHSAPIESVAWSTNHRYALSGSADHSVRLWDLEAGCCLSVLEGHKTGLACVAWGAGRDRGLSVDKNGVIRVWDLSGFIKAAEATGATLQASGQATHFFSTEAKYTNAKVLLVGESGVGKTGLSKALAGEKWEPSDSTVGAWATQWKLPVSSDGGIEREIWLWDFGGQADQRL